MEFIIIPIAGGLIGFFTNWLAIKMIFRPHTKKKIFNINIPFTPGLIPKERYRISEKIGETISSHILTDDVVLSAIGEKDLNRVSAKIYDDLLNSLQNESTLRDVSIKIFNEDNIKNMDNSLKENIENILGKLESPIIKEKIVVEINEFFLELLEKEETKDQLIEFIGKFSKGFDDKKLEFIEKINDDDRKINEVVRIEDIEKFKEIIFENLDPFVLALTNILENEESQLNILLCDLTKTLLVTNIGKMAAMFLNPEKIYDGMRKKLIDYINDDRDDLVEKIDTFIENIINKEISEIPKYISNESIERVFSKIFTDTKDKFIGGFLEDNSLIEQITRVYPDFSIRSKEQIYKYFNYFLENEYPPIKAFLTDEISKYIWSLKLMDINKVLSTLPKDGVIDFIENIFSKTLEKNGKDIINQLEIHHIVEDKINSMELNEIENIILDVAKSELKMITYLGGFIGFIIGFIPILLK